MRFECLHADKALHYGCDANIDDQNDLDIWYPFGKKPNMTPAMCLHNH